MAEGIFVIHSDGQLRELTEQPYDSEDLLQRLLADYPDLLAGKQMDPESPRRWLLVAREAPVPDTSDSPGRWSVDHLFLDQDAIPTLVEAKRSTDTRIRREVVGQMLDYAAHSVVHWSSAKLREQFGETVGRREGDPEAALREFLGPDADQEDFWRRVDRNLQSGRIRMVFVADDVPAELRRIVEFLNRQMQETEVLAVEVRQFVGEGLRTLVPRVIGRTEQATAAKGGGVRPSRQWDEQSFMDTLQRQHGDEALAGAQALLAWARQAGLEVAWGKGMRDGSFSPYLSSGHAAYWLVTCYTYGRVEVLFQYMTSGPFAEAARREELRRRLNQVNGFDISAEALTRRPRLSLATLKDDQARMAFFSALDWAVAETRAWEAASR